jgi:betaine-aldehyde dehydrogenase
MTTSLTIREPATEQVLATVPRADAATVDEAVARARVVLPAWPALAPPARAAMMRRLVGATEVNAEELAALEARNVGKPLAAARGEIAMAIETFRYFSAAPERLW